MSEKIQPALTPKEWARGATDDGTAYTTAAGEIATMDYALGERAIVRHPHALAALALHGQPYGFTWEDVDALRLTLSLAAMGSSDGEDADACGRASSLADRIAALLPPREGK
jgi:hypothetical protein